MIVKYCGIDTVWIRSVIGCILRRDLGLICDPQHIHQVCLVGILCRHGRCHNYFLIFVRSVRFIGGSEHNRTFSLSCSIRNGYIHIVFGSLLTVNDGWRPDSFRIGISRFHIVVNLLKFLLIWLSKQLVIRSVSISGIRYQRPGFHIL